MTYEKPSVTDHGDVFALTASTQVGGPVDRAFSGVIVPNTPQSSAP